MSGERLANGPFAASGQRRAGWLALSVSFGAWQWSVVLLSAGMFAGALIDAWSHIHLVPADPIFNLWHVPVYMTSFGLR